MGWRVMTTAGAAFGDPATDEMKIVGG